MHAARFRPKAEESTVFQGKPIWRDRRSSNVREADELAEAYFAGAQRGGVQRGVEQAGVQRKMKHGMKATGAQHEAEL